MIESIRVFSLPQTFDVVSKYENDFTVWISVVDPEDAFRMCELRKILDKRGILHFVQYFLDYTDPVEENENPDHAPKKKHVKALIAYFNVLKNDPRPHHIGINCYAGVSRSTAVAMIGWMVQGFQPDFAIQKVAKVRKIAHPSNRLLRFYEELTGVNANKAVNEYFESKKHNGIIIP